MKKIIYHFISYAYAASCDNQMQSFGSESSLTKTKLFERGWAASKASRAKCPATRNKSSALLFSSALYTLLFFSRTNNECARDSVCDIYFLDAFSHLPPLFPVVFDLILLYFFWHFDIAFMNETQHNKYRMQNTVSPDSQQNIRKPFKHRSRTTRNTKTRNEIEKVFDCIFDVVLSFVVKTCSE